VKADKGDLAILTRLFSAGVFHELGQQGRSPLFARLARQASLLQRHAPEMSVGDAFEHAFTALRKSGCRDEYVYRSAITQKLLLGRHSLRTAAVIHEMRAGSSKADVVVLNGTSTAYEIKSERDNLTRLPSQLASYRRVFASVNVVTSSRQCREVLAVIPDDVGLLALSDAYTIQVVREPLVLPQRTSPLEILQAVRSAEAVAILRGLGVEVPTVPNTLLRRELAARFAKLDPTSTQDQMVRVLKRTRSQSSLADYVDSLPTSLRAAMLAVSMSERGRTRVGEALATPFGAALAWS